MHVKEIWTRANVGIRQNTNILLIRVMFTDSNNYELCVHVCVFIAY